MGILASRECSRVAEATAWLLSNQSGSGYGLSLSVSGRQSRARRHTPNRPYSDAAAQQFHKLYCNLDQHNRLSSPSHTQKIGSQPDSQSRGPADFIISSWIA